MHRVVRRLSQGKLMQHIYERSLLQFFEVARKYHQDEVNMWCEIVHAAAWSSYVEQYVFLRPILRRNF